VRFVQRRGEGEEKEKERELFTSSNCTRVSPEEVHAVFHNREGGRKGGGLFPTQNHRKIPRLAASAKEERGGEGRGGKGKEEGV